MASDTPPRHWAAPGSRHEKSVRLAKWLLPALALAVLAALALAPFKSREEVGFIFDKNAAPEAADALTVDQAVYRGQDDKGQAFTLSAQRARQQGTRSDGVGIEGIAAQMDLKDGPVRFTADRALYRSDVQTVQIDGPIAVAGPQGFTLNTSNVAIDMKSRQLAGQGRVSGTMELGRFEAGRVQADLGQRRVTLDGGVRLKIRQGAVKGGQ